MKTLLILLISSSLLIAGVDIKKANKKAKKHNKPKQQRVQVIEHERIE